MVLPRNDHIWTVVHSSIVEDEIQISTISTSVLRLDVLEVCIGLRHAPNWHKLALFFRVRLESLVLARSERLLWLKLHTGDGRLIKGVGAGTVWEAVPGWAHFWASRRAHAVYHYGSNLNSSLFLSFLFLTLIDECSVYSFASADTVSKLFLFDFLRLFG